jgi:GTP diphosphokinase / guanosine-3',5'-bis(diphosphate) 3'-diphosphatase
MMTPERLLATLPEFYNQAERDMVRCACIQAFKTHTGQLSHTGRSRLEHPLSVAAILAELGLDAPTVCVGVLHDVLLDGQRTLEEIERDFGGELTRILRAYLSLADLLLAARKSIRASSRRAFKTGKLVMPTSESVSSYTTNDALAAPAPRSAAQVITGPSAARTLQRMLQSAGDDLRALLVQMANHLDRARNLDSLPVEERQQVAQEAMQLYAPLASRLGMWQMKFELEDLGFRVTNPGAYYEIVRRIEAGSSQFDLEMRDIRKRIELLLYRSGLPTQVFIRPMQVYSIYLKMIRKNKPFERVHDLRGVQVIMDDVVSCYAALGVLHSFWRPMPGEFDDYIAAPKDNFYQSLHTTLVYDDGRLLEVQIRTYEMHKNAELGIAAHWRYKDNPSIEETYERRIAYLRTMLDWRQNLAEGAGLPDHFESSLFYDHVYVFTPRGEIIGLPAGATPVDFAYAIHTEIGHSCRGAKVNGKPVTLDWVLKTGDQVEVFGSSPGGGKQDALPLREWLDPEAGFVKTHRARRQIQRRLRQLDQDEEE